jgi:hypothetical protein
MYHVDCHGWSKIKGVIAVVNVVVCDKSCKVGVVVYVKNCGIGGEVVPDPGRRYE